MIRPVNLFLFCEEAINSKVVHLCSQIVELSVTMAQKWTKAYLLEVVFSYSSDEKQQTFRFLISFYYFESKYQVFSGKDKCPVLPLTSFYLPKASTVKSEEKLEVIQHLLHPLGSHIWPLLAINISLFTFSGTFFWFIQKCLFLFTLDFLIKVSSLS